jgi:hypothetical protein
LQVCGAVAHLALYIARSDRVSHNPRVRTDDKGCFSARLQNSFIAFKRFDNSLRQTTIEIVDENYMRLDV